MYVPAETPLATPAAERGRLREKLASASVREVLMGAQDNLTNVLAVVLGVSIGAGRVELVALAGLAAAVAEAISMAGVLYIATLAEHELDARYGDRSAYRPRLGPIAAGTVTGVAAMVAGIIPLVPFAFLDLGAAVVTSVVISLLALFGLGTLTAGMTGRSWRRNGIRLVLIGGAAAIAAAIVGIALQV
jgi:VIT1/CCC1 family predicted Fe2+/Mn2+ transporter